jgi:hypothetical protein
MPKRFREDVEKWRQMLRFRNVQRTWHFAPLVCVPCILFHGAILSIEKQDELGLTVPQRESRDADIAKGVGGVVKLSRLPYWKMLAKGMRTGKPEAILELTIDPIIWEGTYFGNANVWEIGWKTGESLEFASEKVFVSPSKWECASPPEIYVPEDLPLKGTLIKIYTVLEEERRELSDCLHRLEITGGVDVFAAGFSAPYPDTCRDEYLKNQPEQFKPLREYLRSVSEDSLKRGIEIG